MKSFVPLARPVPGDRVAVVSPSAALPGLFPHVHELGLARLRDVFGLEPVEYPTTRQFGASYEERARDLTAAFADPDVKAVLCSTGGEDQIGLIRRLDPAVFAANPKPFFGYSDNTHLHNFLWRLGVPSFYGASTMVQLGMPGGMHDLTVDSLRRALFTPGDYEVRASMQFTDVELDWADPSNLERARPMEPNEGRFWDAPDSTRVEGVLWGGCAEVLMGVLMAGQHVPAEADLDGVVLYLETSEVVPDPFLVGYLVTAMGERGWLDRFAAVLVGRPKAWAFDKPNQLEARAAYRKAQRDAIIAAVRRYHRSLTVVQGLDFGHTDPQIVVPSGGRATIDPAAGVIRFTY
jgi:muramoyltetrapeptide carboxypeptidase LdcA involved in peptidoglycan recycling